MVAHTHPLARPQRAMENRMDEQDGAMADTAIRPIPNNGFRWF